MQMRCWEIRREAWQVLWKERWFWRLLGISIVLGFVGFAANQVLMQIYAHLQIAHWSEYLSQYVLARMGEDILQVPSRETAWRMTAATGAAVLLSWVFASCARFGESVVLLRAARGQEVDWKSGIWRGFSTPFVHLALTLITNLAIGAVSLVAALVLAAATGGRCFHDFTSFAMLVAMLQVPAFITWGYFQPLWLVRAEHLDWSLGECLAEARHRMKGHRYALLRLLQSYWALPLGTLLVLLALGLPAFLPYALPVLAVGVLPFFLVVPWHMRMGVAIFWRELEAESAVAPVESLGESGK